MKAFSLVLVALPVWLLSNATLAQPALESLEGRLRGEAEPAPELDAQPVERGYLGLVTDDRREAGRGVRILQVIPASPAEVAGLDEGDLITAIGGQAIGGTQDMAAVLQPRAPGDTLAFEVSRGGRIVEIPVKLGTRPAAPAADAAGGARRPLLGVRTQPISEETRRRLKLPDARGALVVAKTLASPADRAGIPLDSVIIAVDGQPIEGPAELAELVQRAGVGTELALTYVSGGETVNTTVRLADAVAPPDESPPGELPAAELPAPEADDDRGPAEDLPMDRLQAVEDRLTALEKRLEAIESRLPANRPVPPKRLP